VEGREIEPIVSLTGLCSWRSRVDLIMGVKKPSRDNEVEGIHGLLKTWTYSASAEPSQNGTYLSTLNLRLHQEADT